MLTLLNPDRVPQPAKPIKTQYLTEPPSPQIFVVLTDFLLDVHNLGESDTKCLLIGNKSDLVKQREVTEKQALALAKKYGLNYIETRYLIPTL